MSTLDDLATATRTARDRAAPAVVGIGRRHRGSGVVVAPHRVLTRAHTLRARTTQVTFAAGTTAQAALVGSAADRDVVVLDVPTGDVAAIPWADATARTGDVVFGIGRSGTDPRVTTGTVSAEGRTFRGPRGRRVRGALEHTAPLARGSSGGPLVDAEGRLVGVNTHRVGDGFYLALPADAAMRERVDQLLAGQHLHGRRLGVAVVPGRRAADLRRRVGLPDQPGLLISDVAPDSPAGATDLAEGDLITEVDGTAVATVDDLWDALDEAGDQLRLTVVRGTDQRTVELTFADEHDDGDGTGG